MRFIFLCFVLFSGVYVQAQVRITGRVIDSAHRSAIPYASLSLQKLSDSVTVRGIQADSAGRFELPDINPGNYVLKITALNYRAHQRPLRVEAQATTWPLGYLTLLRDDQALEAVVVSGERRGIQVRDDRTILQVAGNTFFRASANVLDILAKAPGLAVNADGSLLMQGRNVPVIFVDGKPTAMSAEEQVAYLNGLTPDQVESVELIANPSARYDAQYKAIIDIRLRKQGQGWKGSVTSSLRQSKYPYADNSFQVNLGANKFTYGLRAGYMVGNDPYTYQALQHLANTRYMATLTNNKTLQNNLNLQGSVDYQFKKNQTFGLTYKSWQANRERLSLNSLHFSDGTRTQLLDATASRSLADQTQKNQVINLSYDGSWGKHTLNVFGSFGKIRNRQEEDIQNRNSLQDVLMSYWKTALKNDITLRSAQVDYTRSIPNGSLEMGGRFAYITTNNDLRYDTLNTEKKFVPDAGRTNRFLYNEYISAGYLGYSRKVKRFSIKLSLRAEHTYTRADAVTLQEVRTRNYITWLPGVNLSYTPRAHEVIGLSFTRRMTRPTFDQLNPFRFYFSPLNYWVGNPYLLPSVTSIISLTYSYKDFQVALNAGREKDRLTRYPEYNPVTNDLLYLGTNLPYHDFASVELSYAIALTKWWRIVQNGGVYYHKEQMPYFGKTYAIPVTDYSLSGSQVFSLPAGITADVSWRHRSRSGNSLYIFKPIGGIDLGLQKTWAKGTLNTKLNFYDVFNTYITRLQFREENIINNRLSHRGYAQRVVLSVGYSFGKAKPRSRQSRTTEEENRVSN